VNVRWSSRAQRDLEALYEHIAADSPTNAGRMADRIVARLGQIENFPESGRIVPEVGLPYRELIEPPYRIIYRVGRTVIFLVTIVHSSRELRPSFIR